MRRSLTDCQNCNQRFESHYPFCPYCGMKSKDELTLGVLFNNTISNYFSVDARFFKSFIPLMFKPGYLAKCAQIFEIPMSGQKESFNVSVATGIALYALTQ